MDFVTCEWSGTTMGNQRNMTKLLNVNYAPSWYKLPKHCRTSKNQPLKFSEYLRFVVKKQVYLL